MFFHGVTLGVVMAALAVSSSARATVFEQFANGISNSNHYQAQHTRDGAANDCDGNCTGDQARARIQVDLDYDQGPISEIIVEIVGTGPGNIAELAGASWIDGCPEEVAPSAVSRHFDTNTNSYTWAIFSFNPPLLPGSTTAVLQVSYAAGTLNDSLAICTATTGTGFVCGPMAPPPQEAPCVHRVPGRVTLIKPGALAKGVAKPLNAGTFNLPSSIPTATGGTLHIFDTDTTAGDNTYSLPAGPQWKGLGSPPGAKGYKYTGTGTPADPCKVVLLKQTVIKGVCRGSGVTLAPPFTGDVSIVLRLGTTDRYCALFGGDEVKNDPTLTKRKNAPTPAACVGSPSGAFLDGGASF